jgi:hypothetical protein
MSLHPRVPLEGKRERTESTEGVEGTEHCFIACRRRSPWPPTTSVRSVMAR